MTTLTDYVTGIVHEPTQTAGRGLDLTVDAVYTVEEAGQVDFGGGELADATVSPHPSEKRDPDDDYAWWHLDPGQYLLAYNESLSLPAGASARIQPREELLARGAFHPTLDRTALERVPLSVGGAGIALKENARVSTLLGVTE